MENGTAVFEKIWLQAKSSDTQMLSGFLTALSSFAVEALGGGGLQSLQLSNNEQLAFYPHEANFIIVTLADNRDNGSLLNKIMKKIADSFYEEYKNHLDNANLLSQTTNFEETVEAILENKVSPRTFKRVVFGTLGCLALLITIFLLTLSGILAWGSIFQLPETFYLGELLLEQIINLLGIVFAVLSLYITTLFFIPSILAGYFSGNLKWGVITACSLMIISFTLLILLPYIRPAYIQVRDFNIGPWLVTFSPLIFSLTLVTGYVGAWIKERTKLYQLDPERIVIKQKRPVVKS